MPIGNLIEDFTHDIGYAFRVLRRSPGFTATAILALALGIGANTAIFTVVNTVLLQPLAYPEPDRLVQLELSSAQGNGNITSIPKFNNWRAQTQVFSDVAAYDVGGPGINLTGNGLPEQLKGIRVSASYFRVFGAPIAAGRPFSDEEDRPGGLKLAVLSNALWHNRFGGDPSLLGKTLELSGESYIVTGVLAPNFSADPPVDIYLPLQADPNSTDQAHYLRATARLKPGVTLEMAKVANEAAAEEFKRKFPNSLGPQDGFTAEPLRDTVVGDVRKALLVLLGAVSFVLLIACANVANLLLARATLRRREIAIRASIGAGRGRIIRQLLTESVLLSLAGGALGLVLGYAGVRALLSLNPGNIPRIGEHGSGAVLDWRVLVFTLAISFLTGILFGLIPAFNASRTDLIATLKESGSRSGTGLRHNKARSLLVIVEMTLAVVLLVGAGLMIRTFGMLRSVDPGFNAHNVLVMEMSLTGARFEKPRASVNWYSKPSGAFRHCRAPSRSLPRVVFRSRADSVCHLRLRAGRQRTQRTRPARAGAPFRPDISRCSAFRCCAGGCLPIATMRAPRAWWSSMKAWRNNSGPRETRSASASPSAKAWGRSSTSRRARLSASSATCGIRAWAKIRIRSCTFQCLK